MITATSFTIYNEKHVSKGKNYINRGCNKFVFDKIVSYWLKMKGNTKNRSSKLQKIDNALNYFIAIQGVITNETSGMN